jgi:isopentenyl phosphate kinase
MLTFIKLGGSTITHKSIQEAANLDVISRLAGELHAARAAQPEQRIILGHGSGSFGHHYAARYGVHQGLADDADWTGFALTAHAARRLNQILVDALLVARVPALALQPSASLQSAAGELTHWQTETISRALAHNLVPIIHGDVAFDSTQGSAIISTEALFAYLALQTELQPARIILVGETAVYTADPFMEPTAERIPLITSANIGQIVSQAAGSRAVDVTGGMQSKIAAMWKLVEALPHLEIHLIDSEAGLLTRALLGEAENDGTHIRYQ